MEDDLLLPQGSGEGISHVSISGPTLASLLHLLSSSPSDCNGLLFGHLSSPPSPSLQDDDDHSSSPSPSSSPLPSLTITSLLSLSLSLPDSSPSPPLAVGFFSARRSSPLRPSMRERFFLTSSFSQLLPHSQATKPKAKAKPLVLLLLTSSPSPNLAVHTHDFRAFQLRPGGAALEPRPVHVVNVGPAFRGQYGAFAPMSRFPWVRCGGGRGGPLEGKERETVDAMAEGFGAERLRRMAGAGPTAHVRELEELYGRMLARLAHLSHLVEESSKQVDEQESRNMKLRSRIAGLE